MSACRSCPDSRAASGEAGRLVQLVTGRELTIALAGNPNTGKSTIFNHLTGLNQHTGNWPGKTVTRAEGTFRHDGKRYRLVDLPGTYSLLADSTDEEVARDYVLFDRPDCTVIVCDATVLERNLFLVLQILEITSRAVVCVNLIDEAQRKGIETDAGALERELGAPVVLTAARRGKGIDRLKDVIADVAGGRRVADPSEVALDPRVEAAAEELIAQFSTSLPNLPCPRWVALRLLDGDERVERALAGGEFDSLFGVTDEAQTAGATA